MNIKEIFNSIAESIRNKLDIEDKILPINYSNEIDKIVTDIVVDKDINESIDILISYGISKYNGDIEDLNVARSDLAATSVGDYAIFGGGISISAYTVDV